MRQQTGQSAVRLTLAHEARLETTTFLPEKVDVVLCDSPGALPTLENLAREMNKGPEVSGNMSDDSFWQLLSEPSRSESFVYESPLLLAGSAGVSSSMHTPLLSANLPPIVASASSASMLPDLGFDDDMALDLGEIPKIMGDGPSAAPHLGLQFNTLEPFDDFGSGEPMGPFQVSVPEIQDAATAKTKRKRKATAVMDDQTCLSIGDITQMAQAYGDDAREHRARQKTRQQEKQDQELARQSLHGWPLMVSCKWRALLCKTNLTHKWMRTWRDL